MRRKHFIGGVAGGLILVCLAVAAQAADCGCGGASKRNYNTLSGPPCYSPSGCYNTSPGCCECQPSPCDNAWDGYCQQKAKWQAFFTKVGTPRPTCYYGNRYGYGCGLPTPAVREIPANNVPEGNPAATPAPAKPELPPAPAPEKTSRTKVLYPWMR